MPAPHSARAILRAATAEDHARVDAIFARFALDDPRQYADFLSAQAAALPAVEAALEDTGIERLLPDWPLRRRAPLLAADLSDLGRGMPEGGDHPTLAGDAAMLGAAYVLEGSRLGGAMLRRQVPAELPARFLEGGSSARWRGLLGVLDERLVSAEDIEAAVGAARRVFALFADAAEKSVKA